MTRLSTSNKLVVGKAVRFRQRKSALPYWRYLPVLGLLLSVFAVWQLGPLAVWAYNLERAGRLADAGMRWPEPRLADSLPIAHDDAKLKTALSHTMTATRWRPRHAYAHRLAGQIYTAHGELPQAAAAFEQAHALEPRNPLPAWESALVYERMTEVMQTAPRETILPDLASAPIRAPAVPVDTTFCRDGRPQTCYVGLDRWSQNVAGLPEDVPLTTDVLFMYPPAGVRLLHTIAARQPVLHFVIGLDPNVRTWKSDGATFQIAVGKGNAPAKVVYERTLSRDEARQGWHPGSADLTPWAGQKVTLELRTTGGLAGNTTDDWYAWGNVSFTTHEAAQYAMLAPDTRMRQAWQAVGLDAAKLVANGNQAWEQGQVAETVTWYERAGRIDEDQPSFDTYASIYAAVAAGRARSPLPDSAGLVIHPLADRTQIEAEALQVDAGSPLVAHPPGDPNVGIMVGPSAAVVVVEVPYDAAYRVTIRAQNTRPAPIELQVERNFKPIGTFALERGDMSWQEFGGDTFLKSGLHVIGVRFLNDSFDNGVDRNAVLDWIRIEAKQSSSR